MNAPLPSSRWVAVTERLPDKFGWVLVAYRQGPRIGVTMAECTGPENDKTHNWFSGVNPLPNVTHWMPLPAPPGSQPEAGVSDTQRITWLEEMGTFKLIDYDGQVVCILDSHDTLRGAIDYEMLHPEAPTDAAMTAAQPEETEAGK